MATLILSWQVYWDSSAIILRPDEPRLLVAVTSFQSIGSILVIAL
ncbi:MAG: hypothetical protein ACLUIQ_10905 [Dialister invisus]